MEMEFEFQFEMPNIDLVMETQFRELFTKLDTDGNGQLSKKEFRAFAAQCDPPISSPYLFEIIDTNQNGNISIEEFLAFGRTLMPMVLGGDFEGYLKLVFESCDKGTKGKLTPAEFRKFMKYVGQPVGFFSRGKTLKIFDTDGSGTIDFNEIMEGVDKEKVMKSLGVKS
jgi:Ca2+-binding EF-hand superfamily protein